MNTILSIAAFVVSFIFMFLGETTNSLVCLVLARVWMIE